MISTWRCQICREERPDNKISVLSYPWRDSKGEIIKGGTVNTKYCNDNPKCLEEARKKEKKGEI